MEIYLVRHSTPRVHKDVCYGQADLEVTESFEEESRRLVELLPKNADCYSSPLKRCRLMAEFISNGPKIDDRLKEMSFGAWEEKKWNSINQDELGFWMQDFVNNRPPEGESFLDLEGRVLDFWNEILQKDSSTDIIIYTHGGVIRTITAHILELPLVNAFKFHLDFASVTKVSKHNSQYRIEYLNR